MKHSRAFARLLAPALVLVGLTATAGALTTASAAASGGVITSSGPLTMIQTTADLGCAVSHSGDTSPEFFGNTACGTLIAAGGVLYGPADIPAGGNASPRTGWAPVSQSSSGTGTANDPYRVVTVVKGGPFTVTQIDLYVTGAEYYSTRVDVENTADQARATTVYRAGDCYLQNSDNGYGAADPASGAVSCTAGATPGSRIEQWAPTTPGSRYMEGSYSSVWAQIGSQQPFPDTSMNDTYQDNGAGLSWTKTIGSKSLASFAHLTAFSPTGAQVLDTDGDGYPDSWEKADGGVDTNGDGTPDLKLSDYGATPDKPDVFVQVGWLQTRTCAEPTYRCSTTNRRPSIAALRDVQSAFNSHGVRLHIDAGPTSLMNPDTGATWGSLSQVGDGLGDAPSTIPGWANKSFNWGTAFDGYRNRLLSAQRSRLFHFALYVGRFNPDGNSGLSRSQSTQAGRDFMLAYDVSALNNGHPNRIQESGTFMHELGHNLGLSHGGSLANVKNYKPNYPSVMNYTWQLSGVPKNDSVAALDYSEGTLASIDEQTLVESTGLDPDSAASNIGTRWVCPNGKFHDVKPSVRDLDWNCDGHITSTPEAVNLNNAYGGDTSLTVMSDNNDWASLVYDGGGSLGAAGDAGSAPAETGDDDEVPASILLENAVDHAPVTFDSVPGQLVMHSGSISPLPITVTNHRDTQVTYQLAATAQGVGVAGVPDHITLAAGASTSFTATLTAGTASDNAFFEIDADGGDESNTASAVIEVYVTDQQVPDQPSVPGALDHVTVTPVTSIVSAGTPVPYTATGYDAHGTSLGKLDGATYTITPDGTCAGATCTATTAGAHVVTAFTTIGTTTVAGAANLTVTAGPATAVVATTGDGQSAQVGQAFGDPLGVRVVDDWNNPVGGAPVTFTATGAAIFAGGSTTASVITATDGTAMSPVLTAGTADGPITVAATSGSATPANFTLTITQPTKNRADLAVDLSAPVAVTSGVPFTVTLRVNNRGPNTATKTLAAVNIPCGFTVVDNGGGKEIKGAVVFRPGTLASGQTITYSVQLKAARKLRNRTTILRASVLSATPDPALGNNRARVSSTVS